MVAPLPVSTRTFHDGALPAKRRDELDCDIVYVGHMQGTIDSHYGKWRAQNARELHPVLNVIYQRVLQVLERGQHIVEPAKFLGGILAESGVKLCRKDFENMAYWFAYRLFDLAYRQQTLQWAGEWAERSGRRFRIYGRNWEDHPHLARFAMGPIEHGEPLRQVYRGARLVLQAIPGGFLHQRTYEALASGALPLVRYSPGDFLKMTPEEFDRRPVTGEPLDCTAGTFPRLSRVVFRSAQEFESLAERYLADEGARQAVLGDYREVVFDKYAYNSVLARIMAEIKSRVNEPAAACLA